MEAMINNDEVSIKKDGRTILLYSPDMDFCVSLRLLFQDQYKMITLSDPTLLVTLAKEFEPDLLIVDGTPSERMKNRFEIIKQQVPHVRIMILYVPRFDKRVFDTMSRWVDVAFSKPIDLIDVTQSIQRLVTHPA